MPYDQDLLDFGFDDPFQRMQRRQQQQLSRMGFGGMQRQPAWDPMRGEEAETWKQYVANKGMSGLSALGYGLDLPGSTVRDAAGLLTDLYEGDSLGEAWRKHNPLNQWLPQNWFNNNARESGTGRDLLERWGAPANTDKGWIPDRWDMLGFGAEVVLDPLTYLNPFGAMTKIGGSAAKTGLTDMGMAIARRREAITRAAGLAPGHGRDLYQELLNIADPSAVQAIERGIGKREAKALTTLEDMLQPDTKLFEAPGLTPIASPISGIELTSAQNRINSLTQAGHTPHTTDPYQWAIEEKFQDALADAKWYKGPRTPTGTPTKEGLRASLDSSQPIFASYGVHVPFTSFGWAPNKKASAFYMQYARAMDSFGKAAFDNYVARSIKTHFQPFMKGVVTPEGRATVQAARDLSARIVPQVRKFVQGLDEEIKRLAETNPIYQDQNLRSLLTGWGEVHLGQPAPAEIQNFVNRINEFDQGIMDEALLLGNDISPFDQQFSPTWDYLETQLQGVTRPTGGGTLDGRTFGTIPAAMFEQWVPRTIGPSAFALKQGGMGRAARALAQAHEHNKGRWGAIVGIGGGEETINGMARDVANFRAANPNATPQQIAAHLQQRWGPGGANLVSDTFTDIDHGFYRTRTGALKRTLSGQINPRASGRFQELARWFGAYSDEQLQHGLLVNSPMADFQNAWTRAVESNMASKAILQHVAAYVQPAAVFSDGVPLKKFLEDLNLRPGDDVDLGALAFIRDKLHPSRGGNTIALQDLGQMMVPREMADDLLRFNDIHRNSNFYSKVLDWWDNMTNLFKFHATIPFPAFHTRNLYGGQYQNFAAGMWSAWSVKSARNFLEGRTGGERITKIPMIKRLLEEQGLDINEKNASDLVRSLIHQYDVYADRAFSQNPVFGNMLRVSQDATDIDVLGTGPAQAHQQRSLLNTDPNAVPGQGYSRYVQAPSLGERSKNWWENLQTYFRGTADNRGTGVVPHPLKSTDPSLDKFSDWFTSPIKRTKAARIFHPGEWSWGKVRGVGDNAETTFGAGVVGEKFSHQIEGLNRVSAFLELLDQGMDPAKASLKVRAAQIDYSARNFGELENTALTRIFPFWKWQSRMVPHVIQMLVEHPGGIQAQTIRASTLHQRDADENSWIPKRVKDLGLAIPGPKNAEGDQRFLTSIDLPYEGALAPFVFGSTLADTVGNMGRAIGGNASPVFRAPLESVFGEQLYTGRDLYDVKGGLSTLAANLKESYLGIPAWEARQTQVKLPWMADKTAKMGENLLAGQFGRLFSTLRPLTEPPSRIPESTDFWTKALLNTFTGAKLADYNIPEEQARELKPAIENLLEGNPRIVQFSQPVVPKEYKPYLTPEEQGLMRLLQTLNKERKETSDKKRKRLADKGVIPQWAIH